MHKLLPGGFVENRGVRVIHPKRMVALDDLPVDSDGGVGGACAVILLIQVQGNIFDPRRDRKVQVNFSFQGQHDTVRIRKSQDSFS